MPMPKPPAWFTQLQTELQAQLTTDEKVFNADLTHHANNNVLTNDLGHVVFDDVLIGFVNVVGHDLGFV